MRKDKKSLAETHPEVARQWHPKLNGDLTPNDVTKGSNKKVWWKCQKGDDHEWNAMINSRSKGSGCPICSGLIAAKSTSLATLNPRLSLEWHPTKNGKTTPFDVRPGSDKFIWWVCLNDSTHIWKQRIEVRNRGKGCPFCSGHRATAKSSLSYRNPQLASELHPTKNKNLSAENITMYSHKKVWWICSENKTHTWKASVANRAKGDNCPICRGLIVTRDNCLAKTHPEIAKQWHPTKNGKLTPFDIHSGNQTIKIWWKCDKGDDHEWQTYAQKRKNSYSYIKTGKRKKDDGCPFCYGRIASKDYNLKLYYPKIAKEFDEIKNGIKSNEVTPVSGKKVWWICSKNKTHTWMTRIASRTTTGTNCPYCDLTPQSKQELIITFELIKLFKDIDPKGLKTKLEGRLRAIDIFIPKLNLCIEFDGSYWHKGKRELDKIKSEMLFEEGFELIRVREEPLKKIYDTDVISKKPYNGKQVTNDILSVILNMFDLDQKLISRIKEYQSKDDLQNEKGLEKYIDKILTEKTDKKSSKSKTAK